jgi:transcription antitermination factor NusA-like protein
LRSIDTAFQYHTISFLYFILTMNKRYNSSFQVNPKFVGALIGKGGSNVKRITQDVGNSSYIKAFNTSTPGKTLKERAKNSKGPANAFYIESSSPNTIHSIIQMLQQNLKSLQNSCKKSNRPSKIVIVKPESVGTIIGQGGSGLRKIQELSGDNSYIVHRTQVGGFIVSADTLSAINLAHTKIKEAEASYFDKQQTYKRNKVTKSSQYETGTRFEGIELSSDEDEQLSQNTYSGYGHKAVGLFTDEDEEHGISFSVGNKNEYQQEEKKSISHHSHEVILQQINELVTQIDSYQQELTCLKLKKNIKGRLWADIVDDEDEQELIQTSITSSEIKLNYLTKELEQLQKAN